jgi:hypothetical protein
VLYVDEFQNIATESFETVLTEARKFRLCLTMAHQSLKQLDAKLVSLILANAQLQVQVSASPPKGMCLPVARDSHWERCHPGGILLWRGPPCPRFDGSSATQSQCKPCRRRTQGTAQPRIVRIATESHCTTFPSNWDSTTRLPRVKRFTLSESPRPGICRATTAEVALTLARRETFHAGKG